MFDSLFSPIRVRGLELKNRVKMPGAAVCMHDKGFVTDRMIAYQVARARGGCGLNTVEATSIHAPTAPEGLVNMSEDKYIPGLTRLCAAIHQAGGKCNVQMDQGGISTFYVDPDLPVFIPSPKPEFGLEGASVEFMAEVRTAFADSAARAVLCGFDSVEMHVSHGYGLHGFLSAAMNKREDEYGGSLENRARYPLECIRAVRGAIPQGMPIFLRIAPFDDDVENGLSAEDVIQFCKWAGEAGADALDVSRGNCWGHGAKYIVPPMDLPRGFNVENAARLKKETGLITVGVGRINDPAQAEGYIASGLVDMVDIGRAQMADPEFCRKAREGRVEDIVRCIGCLEGCFDRCMSPDYPHTSCLWNPALGEEEAYALKPAAQAKRVLIVGGGVAGMEAALTLHGRGHKVTLAEAGSELGGIFRLAGVAPRKSETLDAVRARAGQVMRSGVQVLLGTEATPALVERLKPDAVILASGGTPVVPPIPGADRPNVVGFKEVLSGAVKPAGRIVVIGGGLVGIETAEYLYNGVNDITVVEMGKSIAADAGSTRAGFIEEFVEEENIHCVTRAKAVEIREGSLVIEKKSGQEELPADYIVIAAGSRPRPQTALLECCESKGIPVYVSGDAKEVGFAIDAIADAAALAREI